MWPKDQKFPTPVYMLKLLLGFLGRKFRSSIAPMISLLSKNPEAKGQGFLGSRWVNSLSTQKYCLCVCVFL